MSNIEELNHNLDLLEEKREQALIRLEAYHQRTKLIFDKNVKHRKFHLGSLVLKKILHNSQESISGKLSPNWEGPYKIIGV